MKGFIQCLIIYLKNKEYELQLVSKTLLRGTEMKNTWNGVTGLRMLSSHNNHTNLLTN